MFEISRPPFDAVSTHSRAGCTLLELGSRAQGSPQQNWDIKQHKNKKKKKRKSRKERKGWMRGGGRAAIGRKEKGRGAQVWRGPLHLPPQGPGFAPQGDPRGPAEGDPRPSPARSPSSRTAPGETAEKGEFGRRGEEGQYL